MNSEFAPLLVGIVSCGLLIRSRAQVVKPRVLARGRSTHSRLEGAKNSTIDAKPTTRAPRWLGGNNRAHRIILYAFRFTIPTPMRRWTNSDTMHLKIANLVVGGLGFLLVPTIAPLLLLCALGIGRARKRKTADRLRVRRTAALPDLVDMIRLCVASGCTPYSALVVLGSLPMRADDVLGPLVANAADQLEGGAVITEVLEWLLSEVGEAARPLCSALRSSAEMGTPIAETLDVLAREARRARKAHADAAAKRLPVLLLFPLITCILPAFALLAIAPLLGGALGALRW